MAKLRKLVVQLSKAQKREIGKLLGGGIQSVRVMKRAQSLRLLDAGQSAPEAAGNVGLSAKAVWEIGWRYVNQGLKVALYDRPRPGAVPKIEKAEKQRIIAMVCAQPPPGQARWSLRLIAAEAQKRKLVSQIGRESVRILLQEHDLKPWREKNVVHPAPGRRIY